jgi:hypothetical protein
LPAAVLQVYRYLLVTGAQNTNYKTRPYRGILVETPEKSKVKIQKSKMAGVVTVQSDLQKGILNFYFLLLTFSAWHAV